MNAEHGRWAVVTGASEGIGREFARKLSSRGFRIYAVARNKDRLESLMKELGAGHQYLVADLGHWEDTKKVMAFMEKEHCHLLVNNAGFGLAGLFTEIPLDKQLEMVRVNIDALTSLAHTFLMQAKSGDALINLASVIGLVPYPAQSVYAATKAYVTSLTESLWQRYKGSGIYVQNLCPGSTRTQFFERSRGRPAGKKMMQSAEQVVDASLKAWDQKEGGTIISGGRNKAFAVLLRWVPRRVATSITAQME